MKRRHLISAAALSLLGTPLASWPQGSGAPPKVGFLYFGSKESAVQTGRYGAFIEGMRKLGYTPGKDYILEERFAAGDVPLLRSQLAELLKAHVKLIVATGSVAVLEARQATSTVPIVSAVSSDPIGQGLAKTLAQPGGNVTGLYDSSIELMGKHLELLRAVSPKLSRLGLLMHPANASHADRQKRLVELAQPLKVQVHPASCASPEQIDTAFAEMTRQKVQSVIVLADTFFLQQAGRIAKLALKHRMPSVGLQKDYAEAGGLLSYGEDLVDNFRLAAAYVDKILKGAAPGGLPFARSPRIELTVNKSTARALGLKLPEEITLRAENIIE